MLSASRYSRSTILHSAIFLGAIVACGVWLRFWHIGGQMLLDDEWHAVNFVQGKDFIGVMFGLGLGANSIPVNIWSWIVLNGPGWSELLLRIPSLAAGVAAIAAIPFLVKRLLSGACWRTVAVFIAVSPVLVFYSRVARPYAPAALLGTTSVLLAGIWLRERKERHLYLAASSGALATWWHLYSLVPVGAALLAAAAIACRRDARAGESPFSACALRHWRPALMFIVSLFFLSGIPNLIDPWWLGVFQAGERASLRTLWGAVGLAFGTSAIFLKVACLVLCLRGWIALHASDRATFLVFLSAILAYFLVAMLSRQDGSRVAIQVVRYGIVCVPLLLVVTAVGVQALLSDLSVDRFPVSSPVAILLGVVLYVAGPFPRIYSEPNNFTGHSAFQYDYAPADWKQSRVREFFAEDTPCFPEAELPRFYRTVGNPASGSPRYPGILEYPVFLGDHYNYLYYFQHFHRLPVVGGYLQGAVSRFQTTDKQVFGNFTVDDVRGISVPGARWRMLTDIGDIRALRARYRGWALVVHKDPEQEICAPWRHYDEMPSLVRTWDLQFGDRVYEDAKIVCWVIR